MTRNPATAGFCLAPPGALPKELTMVYFSSDAEIDRIGRGLLDRSLPKAEWTHAAHFAAAFWLLRRSELDAARVMPGLIRACNEATGVPNTETGCEHETSTLGSR